MRFYIFMDATKATDPWQRFVSLSKYYNRKFAPIILYMIRKRIKICDLLIPNKQRYFSFSSSIENNAISC